MKGMIVIGLALIGTAATAQSSHYVSGYTRSNGTYVAGHEQSNSNSTKLDNYSTRGNYNPYSGQAGTVNPYAQTQSNPSGSPYNSGRSGNPW